MNVSAAITTTNGSILLGAGNNLNLNVAGALVTTDGNITLCAGINITFRGHHGDPRQHHFISRPRPDQGLVMIAGNGGTGPGSTAAP